MAEADEPPVNAAGAPELDDRPARLQVQESDLTGTESGQPVGSVYNTWYRRWAGGDRDPSSVKRRNPYRCNIKRDSGYTRADKRPNAFICLHFARGMCFQGPKCNFLHRLPLPTDAYASSIDCFGREKFANYRDDMGGVGSFLRENRTLFVGSIKSRRNINKLLQSNFREWGQLERVSAPPGRGIGFVTYKYEANAQFAKEAMANQALLEGAKDEVLALKWSTEDPNTESGAREEKRYEETAINAILGVIDQQRAIKAAEIPEVDDEVLETPTGPPAPPTPKRPLALVSEGARKKANNALRLVAYSDSEEGESSS